MYYDSTMPGVGGGSAQKLNSRNGIDRISSCALPGASDWLNDVRLAMDMSDIEVRVAVRLRLGLPLSELVPPSCPLCDEDMRDHPNDPLGCVKLRRGGILKRHDSCQNGLARFAHRTSASCTSPQRQRVLPKYRIWISYLRLNLFWWMSLALTP